MEVAKQVHISEQKWISIDGFQSLYTFDPPTMEVLSFGWSDLCDGSARPPLFLFDASSLAQVHMLNMPKRGALLEAVVARLQA